MSLLQAGFGSSGDDYEITDSLRLRSSATAYLNRTPASSSNRKTWTYSVWVKLGEIENDQTLIAAGNYAQSQTRDTEWISINGNAKLFWGYAKRVSGSYTYQSYVYSQALFRDPSAWYHIVVVKDVSNTTTADKVIFYVNGVRQEVDVTNAVVDTNGRINDSTAEHKIGVIDPAYAGGWSDGYITEVNFIDGQALTADDFGAYDANGTWKAKEYTGTYGTNGFYLPMTPTTQAELQNTVLFTGTGDTALEINNVGYEPDFIWFKSTSNAQNHYLVDSVRGGDSFLYSNATTAENTSKTWVSDFTPNGFIATNQLLSVNYDYVGWTWDAGDNQPSTGHSSIHFSGNGAELKLGGFGFSPDLIWMKSRSNVGNHGIWDSVRGASNVLKPNLTDAESSISGVTSFDADGYTLGASYNASGGNYIAWGWDAGDGDPVSNTDGSITSTVKASDTTGFSIVTYSANGSTGTIGHGLSSTPELIIVKKRNAVERWTVYHQSTSNAYIYLNETFAAETTNANVRFGNNSSVVAPTSSVFTVGNSNDVNGSGGTYVAYCFSEVSGVSKFDSYTGNGSTTGPVVTTGFRPGFVMVKNANAGSTDWYIWDSTRDPFLSDGDTLRPNLTNAETSGNYIEFTDTGFQLKEVSASYNASGNTYIYMAFKGSYSDYVSPLNTDGTIDSRVKANPDKGFSIVSYEGIPNGTVGHGLSSAPKVIIQKDRDNAVYWRVFHYLMSGSEDYDPTDNLHLNATNAYPPGIGQATRIDGVTSTTFTSTGGSTGSEQIAYCWTDVAGYSKFGSYTGNGSTTGPVVTTGFRPGFVMVKETTTTSSWTILDSTRDPNNTADLRLFPDLTNAESSNPTVDFLDTGFQLKTSNANENQSGSNFIYMAFADTADARFNFDASGNKNNWLPNNINSNADSETTYDLMKDTPSLVDENAANFAVLNPLDGTLNYDPVDANLKVTLGGVLPRNKLGTMAVSSGKFYWEMFIESATTAQRMGVSVVNVDTKNDYFSSNTDAVAYGAAAGTKIIDGSSTAYGDTFTTGDTIGVALNLDDNEITFYKNGVSQGVITSKTFTGSYLPNFTHGSNSGTETIVVNFGQRPFAYTPPTGFLKLNTFNLPDSTIEDGSDYFTPVLYTGDGSASRDITGLNFQPDWVWIKDRSNARSNRLFDAVRGAGKRLISNDTGAESTQTDEVNSFISNGFNIGSGTAVNNLSETYVAWNWLASNTTASNTDGSITSTVSANTTAGFSIVSYTGVGGTGTVGHGLGATPKFIITKTRSIVNAWHNYHVSVGAGYRIFFSTSAPAASSTVWNNTSPTSTVFSVGDANTNGSGTTMIAYCFAPVEGYSAFGSYTGNGSADGPFVYTGFRPAYVIVKQITTAGSTWVVFDSTRDNINEGSTYLQPDTSSAESTGGSNKWDLLSNGFKLRGTGTNSNSASGYTYIYMAFAENPFKNALAR